MKAEILRPSEIGAAEQAAWLDIMAADPSLRRAFFSPGFALACERAYHRVEIALLHENGEIVGVFPFQFVSAMAARRRSAVRLGEAMSDASGLIARDGVRIPPPELLRLCRLNALQIDHLTDRQSEFGLVGENVEVGHMIELADGGDAYIATLTERNKPFVSDTQRRWRKAVKELGELTFNFLHNPEPDKVEALIAEKRGQYARTAASDVFVREERRSLVAALLSLGDPDCVPVYSELSAGGRIVARHFGLLTLGTLSYWFPVYAPDLQKLSPGRLLLWATIQAAEKFAITVIDRGLGDTQAKRDFSNQTQHFRRAAWYAGNLGGWAEHAIVALQNRGILRP